MELQIQQLLSIQLLLLLAMYIITQSYSKQLNKSSGQTTTSYRLAIVHTEASQMPNHQKNEKQTIPAAPLYTLSLLWFQMDLFTNSTTSCLHNFLPSLSKYCGPVEPLTRDYENNITNQPNRAAWMPYKITQGGALSLDTLHSNDW